MSAGYYAGLRAKVAEADCLAVAAALQAELKRHPADDGARMVRMVRVPLGREASLWLRIRANLGSKSLLVLVGRNLKSGGQSLRLRDLMLARALVWPDEAVVDLRLEPESYGPGDSVMALWGPLPVGGAS